jgi:hypothetical protein
LIGQQAARYPTLCLTPFLLGNSRKTFKMQWWFCFLQGDKGGDTVFEAQLQNILALFQANPIIAVASGGIVVVLFYFKTKEMLKLVGFCLFIAVVFYVLTLLAGTVSTGSKHKDQMIYKSKEVLGE